MYHQVGLPAPKGSPYRGLTVHPSDFRRQMVWLKRLGYRGLSMAQVLPYVRGERHGKVVGLSFDDGYRNVFQNAMPVLDELGFTATNYFVARHLDGSNFWDQPKGVPHSSLMSLPELRAWVASGHEVGSHTLDHVHLNELSSELAAYQITQSKRELENMIQHEVSAFCYPYGHYDNNIRDQVSNAGYTNATTTHRGLARMDDDLLQLPRVTVSRSTNIVRFLQKCLTRLEDNKRRSR
ncbi:polysaccharide deacetylase family protein [Alcaligenes endophyticus]|uniref:Polysaccharide deacetylase family protein n=1 Tax=Alcaligenes endophyticus TaxID=1929088 RepID=A0ABT8ENE3_9BURK|nr:polysaccharide deacetylase family protein [Alcaligenes endophyticus]MCX5591298.1 polysaccharide deacetylase family protein [Alcaligenes endophyticus]MDN4122821.1 polysaccharide deacetylase family protein [Alcaligenes endophyticus]